jgi:thiosulfate dehydrogenase
MRITVLRSALAIAALACDAPQKTPASVPFRVPQLDSVKDSAVRVSAIRGRAILEATRDSLPSNVGNALRCASCHFLAGTRRNALPWVGVYSRFPQYRARDGRVDLIEDRINDCFERSMNGRALPANSSAMRDIVTYFAVLSSGVPAGAQVEGQGLPKLAMLTSDSSRGRALFAMKCVRCHGPNGEGTALAPPQWGPRSFNIGAGMARRNTLAAFIHELMPFDSARTLTTQQAYDLAAYIGTRPRPDFKGKEKDWPNGGAPSDVAYRVNSNATTATPKR